MWRYAVGGIAALLLVAAGVFLFTSRATTDRALPSAPAAAAGGDEPQDALDTVPEATRKTREEKRFGRYDKDRNGAITREEYLTARRKAFAKLDINHDGTLSFDELAAKTETKFAEADKDKSGTMTPAEFVATAPKRTAHPRCACQPAAKPASEDDN